MADGHLNTLAAGDVDSSASYAECSAYHQAAIDCISALVRHGVIKIR